MNYELFAFVLILNDRPSRMMTDYIFSCLSVILNYRKSSTSQHRLCQVLTCTIILSLTQNYCLRDLAYRSPGVWSLQEKIKIGYLTSRCFASMNPSSGCVWLAASRMALSPRPAAAGAENKTVGVSYFGFINMTSLDRH